MRSLLAALLAPIAIALPAATHTASAQGTPPPAPAAAIVAFALDQFKALEPAVTLAKWHGTHPAEPVIRYVPPMQFEHHEGWCARVDRTVRPGGQQVRRTA